MILIPDTILASVLNYTKVIKFISLSPHRLFQILLGNVVIIKDVCKMGFARGEWFGFTNIN